MPKLAYSISISDQFNQLWLCNTCQHWLLTDCRPLLMCPELQPLHQSILVEGNDEDADGSDVQGEADEHTSLEALLAQVMWQASASICWLNLPTCKTVMCACGSLLAEQFTLSMATICDTSSVVRSVQCCVALYLY